MRRFPLKYNVPVPNAQQREHILTVMLRSERLVGDFDFRMIAHSSEGFTGSDLRDLAKRAVQIPLREFLQEEKEFEERHGGGPSMAVMEALPTKEPRPLRTSDFLESITSVQDSVMFRSRTEGEQDQTASSSAQFLAAVEDVIARGITKSAQSVAATINIS